jgi:hypothetical protein
MKEIKETVIAHIEKFISWVTRIEEPLYYYIRFRVAMVCIFSLALYSGKTFYTMKELEKDLKNREEKIDLLKKKNSLYNEMDIYIKDISNLSGGGYTGMEYCYKCKEVQKIILEHAKTENKLLVK